MNIVIASVEFVCIAILLVLVYGLIFETKNKGKREDIYAACVVITILSLAADSVSWYFDGRTDLKLLLDIVNPASMMLGEILVAVFGYYVIEVINSKRIDKLSYRLAHIPAVFGLSCVISIAVLNANGLVFSVEDGWYNPGEFYSVSAYFCGIIIAYLFVIIITNAKVLGRHDTIALITYIAIPLMGTLIEIVFPAITLSLITSAIACMVLFVMLQSGQVKALRMRGEILNNMSYKDSLTGLLNRRSFDDELSVNGKDRQLGVIFCDVNGLKYANDHFGHEAGNKLLTDFSDILRKHFSESSIYRISGDEFTVVIYDIDEGSFTERAQALKDETFAKKEAASIGWAYGDGVQSAVLLKQAEDKMYEDKLEFYKRNPKYARNSV